jgi:hypothetical protein
MSNPDPVDLDHDPRDNAYWWSRTPAERLQAQEYLRQKVYGYDPATARIERFFEVVQLQRNDAESDVGQRGTIAPSS